MTISTIRRYEDEDKARVRAAAERFAKRHGISFDAEYFGDCDAENRIDQWIYDSHPQDMAYRRKLWTACYCRALRVPCDVRTTTGYGYIGIRID